MNITHDLLALQGVLYTIYLHLADQSLILHRIMDYKKKFAEEDNSRIFQKCVIDPRTIDHLRTNSSSNVRVFEAIIDAPDR